MSSFIKSHGFVRVVNRSTIYCNISKIDYEVDSRNPAWRHCVDKGKLVACLYKCTGDNSVDRPSRQFKMCVCLSK
jgi:hypothetical protein